MVLKPLSLTYVRYEEGDLYGKALAFVSLLPMFLGMGFVTLFLARRELIVLVFGVGQILNDILNLQLKKLVNEARPFAYVMQPVFCIFVTPFQGVRVVNADELWSDRVDPGMPSRHSQFIGFFFVFSAMFMFKSMKTTRKHEVAVAFAGLSVLSLGVLHSRTYLGYHTVAQVAVGAGIGAVLGLLWYSFVEKILRPYFPKIEELWLSRLLLIKDSSHITDVLAFEYQNSLKIKSSVTSSHSNKKRK